MKSRRSRRAVDNSKRECKSFEPNQTVLHVDDDANDAELLRAATRKAHLHIKLYSLDAGEQAIDYLTGIGRYADRRRFQLPALVLLDLKMPRTSGFDVLKWIRSRQEFASIPVVIFSGSHLADDMNLAFQNGANSYFIKPLAFDALVQVVRGINSLWLNHSSRRGKSVEGHASK